MSSKFRQRCLYWFAFVLLGLSIGLYSNFYSLSPGMAEGITAKELINTQNVRKLEQQAEYYYSLSLFDRAIELWQQAEAIYDRTKDISSRGRVLSNLALAYSKVNDWQQAEVSINSSLEIVQKDSRVSSGDKIAVLAQIWNNKGILELNRGSTELAIASWERAKVNYQLLADDLGIIRASINQASAYKELGLYRRALNTLSKVEQDLAQQPDSGIKATGLRNYGDILRLVGNIKESQAVLKTSLKVISNLDNPQEEVKTLIALGNSYKNNPQQALKFYNRAFYLCHKNDFCQTKDLPLQINLAKANLLIDSPQWRHSQKLISSIEKEFARLPDNPINIDRKINFANILIKLKTKYTLQGHKQDNIPDFIAIDRFLKKIIAAAKVINYQKAQSYSWGLRGQIQEQLQELDLAQKYSQQALVLSQKLNAPEIVYLWQWQLGRIDKKLGERGKAIAHYSRAVELLNSLSQDLVAINSEVQYSFRQEVEPVYRELVSLLLTADGEEAISQANLEGGRKTIESLQLAELNNFFREACLKAQAVDIDNIDPQAAVIYPIILKDRLEVIVSLPNLPLEHYTVKIDKNRLEAVIAEFRQNIVIRSRRNFYSAATKLYDFLIRPALADLTSNKIKTLVFVPDGSLRNIPLSALYDGQQYLIENYNIALTPGLQLLAPRPLEQMKLKTIAVGLTKSRHGFSPLNHVDSELQEIENTVNGDILIDREFTTEALREKIQYSDYPIVHIATHGQFSSSMEDTFLLAWDDRINIDGLDNILQTRSLKEKDAIELLVLSACETASGDQRAALGLAGIAVRGGARSTLATLWSIDDYATSELMKNFYRQLSNKHLTKGDAVRQAQLSLLHSSAYKHPFYWSAYVLLGNWL